jgi:hypothetical protein
MRMGGRWRLLGLEAGFAGPWAEVAGLRLLGWISYGVLYFGNCTGDMVKTRCKGGVGVVIGFG